MAVTCGVTVSFFAYISFEGWRGRPRHGGGAERVRTQVSTDREGSPGTPVADELAWEDSRGNLVFDTKIR